jgi:hypothetical protein
MSTGVEPIIKHLFDFAKTKSGKILYPGVPFLLVPALLASLIVGQFSGSLTYYPDDRPAALKLPVGFNHSSSLQNHATLLVVPTASEFFLRSSGEGIESVWLSMEPSKVGSNRGRVALSREGLGVGSLRGVGYPLVMVVAGEHKPEIDLVGEESQALPRLEFATSLSNWVVFFLLGGAIFGFGASTGFVNDSLVIKNKDARVHKGHDER